MSVSNKRTKEAVSSKMTKAVIIMFAALVAIFAAISFLAAKFRAETESSNTMYNASNVISGLVCDHMTPKLKAAESAAYSETAKNFISSLGSGSSLTEMSSAEGYEDICAMLDELAYSDNDVISAWIISESGKSLLADGGRYLSPEELNLESLYWHRELGLEGTARRVFCSAYAPSLFDKNENAVSVIAPVYAAEHIVGYVGLEIKLSSITKILEQYTLNSGCYPVISSGYGSMIYSPSSQDFTSRFNVNSAPLINVLRQSSLMKDGIDSYSSGAGFGDTIYFSIDNTSVPNWSVIVLFDSEVLNGGLYRFCFIEVIILICLMVIFLIVMRNKLEKEIVLLPRINEAVLRISEGDYKYTIDTAYCGQNSLSDTAEKINSIAASLNSKAEIIRQYTDTDILTGLPNRMSLYSKIETLIERSLSDETISDSGHFAVMFVDVDNFKWLNETLGHNFGDAVLCTFANTLSDALRKTACVYRFSGDEFIILVEFGNDYNKIYKIIRILQNAFANPIRVMTDNIYLKFSMGVSIFPDDASTADMLLRDADVALHRAKENGKDRVSFYTNATNRRQFGKAAIAQLISDALKTGEMYLNYQPIISADTCDIHGFEVLLRWNNQQFGNIPPTEFISVAEETGAIVQIGMWIFENACRFLKVLCDNYRDDIIMSINVSPVQLKRADYLETIQHVIEITQVNPKNIQIEITESTLIDFVDNKDSVIEKINDMGISLALDDFGTGYSSLNYLKNFPIKCLKIDKSFVDEINNNKRDQAITDSIIDLVHSLGIKTVAEGIETVGQYSFLKGMKCDYIQGFLMSKPLDEEAALEFVERYDDLHKPDSRILAEHEKQLADEKHQRELEKEHEIPEAGSSNLVDGTISK